MDEPSKVRLLAESDIFDVYGCEWLLKGFGPAGEPLALTADDLARVRSRVYELHALYVASAKARIRSEARFCRVQLSENMTFAEMLARVRELLAANLQRRQLAGGPVNLMQEVLRANMAAGMNMDGIDLGKFGMAGERVEQPPRPEVDPEWFRKGSDSRVWDNPKWYDISKAYLNLEAAGTPEQMIRAIDRLNQLQHNSFHILIDLQTGRMLENASEGQLYGQYEQARRGLQRVLDICHGKRDAYEFADQMSPEIRAVLNRYRGR